MTTEQESANSPREALPRVSSPSRKPLAIGAIVVLAEERHGAIECAVKDTGEGIPPERIERVFDKLETDPDPERQGMGLGLAIVKQAVEAHNGTVTVESSSGVGTTFRFTLPLSAQGSFA